jgi:hypothetical protein
MHTSKIIFIQWPPTCYGNLRGHLQGSNTKGKKIKIWCNYWSDRIIFNFLYIVLLHWRWPYCVVLWHPAFAAFSAEKIIERWLRWKWACRIGSVILTGENRNTRSKCCVYVGGSGTALQTGRSRVGFSLGSLKNFHFRQHCGPGVDSASNRNEYHQYLLGDNCGQCVRLTALPPSCAGWLELLGASTSSEHSRPAQICTGIQDERITTQLVMFSPLKTKGKMFYLKTQVVPHSEHFSSRS